MSEQAHIGWLYSLASGSNWGHVHFFHGLLKTKADPIIISSEVWGRKKRKEFDPQPGDGIALYHSSNAEFPADDPYKKKPRISIVGELRRIESDGIQISWLEIRVERSALLALTRHPIIRDDTTRDLFERCEIVPGFPASLYRADRPVWKRIVSLLDQRRPPSQHRDRTTASGGKKSRRTPTKSQPVAVQRKPPANFGTRVKTDTPISEEPNPGATRTKKPGLRTVSVPCVTIPESMANIAHGRKYEEEGRWILASKRGVPIAAFLTEDVLDEWWKLFQQGLGRIPHPLIVGRFMPQRTRCQKGKRRSTPDNQRSGDYLKPWSDKYDMPEYDLE